MTTRTVNQAPQTRATRQPSLSSSRDPGDLRRDAIELLAPAISTVIPLTKLGVGANGRGTYFFRGTVTDAGNGVEQQVLFAIENATTNDRFWLRNPSANTSITFIASVAGVTAGSASPGSITDATEFRIAMAIVGDGTARCSLNGGAVVSVAGGVTSGLLTLALGATDDPPSLLMAGSIARVTVQPGFAVPDAELIAMTA